MYLSWPLVELELDGDRITVSPKIVRSFEPRTISKSGIQAVVHRRFGPVGRIEFISATGETMPLEFGYIRLGRLLRALVRRGWPVCVAVSVVTTSASATRAPHFLPGHSAAEAPPAELQQPVSPSLRVVRRGAPSRHDPMRIGVADLPVG